MKIQHVLSPGPPEPEPGGRTTLKDPRLTAGAVGSSPARLTVAGVGGNTAAVHALLRTQGYRGPGEREEEQEQTMKTNHLVKEHKPLYNDSPRPTDVPNASLALEKNQATSDLSYLINSEMHPTRVCFIPALFPQMKPTPEEWQPGWLFKNIFSKA